MYTPISKDMMSEPTASRIARRRAAAKSQSAPDYQAKRAEIVRAAAEVFRAKGYGSATLNDVAAVIGTDRASVYYYFASKEELFEECITETVVVNLARAKKITARNTGPREKLHELISMLVSSQVEHYPYMYVFMQENMAHVADMDSEWAKVMVKNTHRLEKYFIDTLRAGVADGSFRDDLSVTLVANSLFGMTQWTHRWWVPGESRYATDDLVRAFTAVLLEGIDPRP